MLSRIWATLRTLYLFFIIGYALWATPLVTPSVARTFDEQYARTASFIPPLQRALWLAIGWIALDTVVGWISVRWAAKPGRVGAPAPAPAPAQEPKPTPRQGA